MTTEVEIIEYLFWHRVRECLFRYLGFDRTKAARKTRTFRSRYPSPRSVDNLNVIYHAKPFDVACKIAEATVDYNSIRTDYLAMLGETSELLPPQKPSEKVVEMRPAHQHRLAAGRAISWNYKQLAAPKKASQKPAAKKAAAKKAAPKKAAAPRKPAKRK
jgi:hypothetical protein